MKKTLAIKISTAVILLAIAIAFIINNISKQNINNIRIYKNTMNYVVETSSYEYEEIILDSKEKDEISKYYSRIDKRDNDIEEAYIGTLMIKSDDGSGMLYDNGKYALYYEDIDTRDNGENIILNDKFVDFLSKYL